MACLLAVGALASRRGQRPVATELRRWDSGPRDDADPKLHARAQRAATGRVYRAAVLLRRLAGWGRQTAVSRQSPACFHEPPFRLRSTPCARTDSPHISVLRQNLWVRCGARWHDQPAQRPRWGYLQRSLGAPGGSTEGPRVLGAPSAVCPALDKPRKPFSHARTLTAAVFSVFPLPTTFPQRLITARSVAPVRLLHCSRNTTGPRRHTPIGDHRR